MVVIDMIAAHLLPSRLSENSWTVKTLKRISTSLVIIALRPDTTKSPLFKLLLVVSGKLESK